MTEEDKEQVAPARTAEFDAALSLYASLFPEQYATECDNPNDATMTYCNHDDPPSFPTIGFVVPTK